LKFREFIEEEDAVVAEGDFARARNCAAADEASIADSVMRGAIRARADEAAGIFECARNGMNARGFDGFFEKRMLWPPAQATSRARLADCWPWTSRRSTPYVRGFAEKELRIDLNRGERFGSVDEVDGLGKRFYRVDFDAVDDGCFASVGLGNSECDEAAFARGEGGG